MTDLDARYGRTPTSRRRIGIWVSAGVLVLAALVWFVWANPIGIGQASLGYRDTGYRVVSDAEVMVQWEVTVTPGVDTECALQALSENFSVVGWKIVSLPASETITRQFSESVLTSERASTGLAYRCWIA